MSCLDPSAVSVWVDATQKFSVPIIALAGAIYTALQYRRAKGWRAGDLAVSLVSKLETDEELAFACRALDWGTGPLVVPTRYQPLLETDRTISMKSTPLERGEVMYHDCDLLALAVRIRLEFNPKEKPQGLIYRYCFDKLCGHLSNISRLVDTGQLNINDLYGLKYWLDCLSCYQYAPEGVPKEHVFAPFIFYEPYGYKGVIELGRKLGVSFARGNGRFPE